MTLRHVLAAVLLLVSNAASSFDHDHGRFADVLQSHVTWNAAGTGSSVDYAALQADPAMLETYLAELSAVTAEAYARWAKPQQLAFLINAYNAFTLKLILDNYPIDSIRSIGSFWQNPWKRRFFSLLGQSMHLDQVEHDIIRAPGVFDDPRIHFAVNCASVGCPALRPEPFVAGRLDRQLEDGTRRFLADDSRNRFRDGRLEISSIFDWYREDFEGGWRGADSLHAFLSLYADALALPEQARGKLAGGSLEIHFLDYDWSLNGS